MFTDRDLVVMIEIAQELRAAICKNQKEQAAGNITNFQIDTQSVEDLCGFVLAQNEAFDDDEEDNMCDDGDTDLHADIHKSESGEDLE